MKSDGHRSVRQLVTRRRVVISKVAPGWHDPDFSEMKMMGVWSETTKQAEYVARRCEMARQRRIVPF